MGVCLSGWNQKSFSLGKCKNAKNGQRWGKWIKPIKVGSYPPNPWGFFDMLEMSVNGQQIDIHPTTVCKYGSRGA